MSQIGTRKVSMSSVVRSPAFREGFNDYMNGREPQFDRDWNADRRKSSTDKSWAYERGRLFGAWFKSKGYTKTPKWFIDRSLNWRIERLASDACWENAIR